MRRWWRNWPPSLRLIDLRKLDKLRYPFSIEVCAGLLAQTTLRGQ